MIPVLRAPFLIACLALAAPVARADDDAALVGVRETVEAALASEPGLESAVEEARAAEARVAAARSSLLPRVGVAGAYGRQRFDLAAGTIDLDSRATRVTASQLLFSGGAALAELRRAREVGRAAEFSRDAARSGLVVEAAAAHAELAAARDAVAAQERAAAVFAERLREIEARRREGFDTLTDVALARARQLQTDADLAGARARLAAAEAAYARLTGREPPPALREPRYVGERPASLEAAIALALERNATLRGASAQTRAAEQGMRVARASFAPRVALELEASRADDSFFFLPGQRIDGKSASIQVSVPVFEGGLRLARAREASAVARSARARERRAEDLIRESVRAIWAEVDARRLALLAAQARLEATRTAAEGTRLERGEGLRTTADLLEVERSLRDAELARSESLAALFVSQLQLADTLGLLQPVDLR